LVKFGESVDLSLKNNTVGNSTCLGITTGGGPKPTLSRQSNGNLVESGDCGGYRADHFSDADQKHYQIMQLRFSTPKVVSPKTCKATYKVIADSGGKASRSTIVATNPRCGGWSGTITFQRQSQWSSENDMGGPFESSVHQSADLDVQISLQNGVGVANSEASLSYDDMAFQGALRGQQKTRIQQSSTNTKGKAVGGSEATVEVQIDPKSRTYTVLPEWRYAAGSVHSISTHRDQDPSDTTSPFYANPFDGSHFSRITGKFTNPKHLQGTWSETMPPPYGNAKGQIVNAVTWNLTFTPARK
jgi:hypothetical protein